MRILGVLHPGGGRSGLLAEQTHAAGDELVEWLPARGEPMPDPLEAFEAGLRERAAAGPADPEARSAPGLPLPHG